MREIRLANRQYPIVGNIIRSAINPFRPKLGATGELEWEDFSQATRKEYYDFRNGLGCRTEIPGRTGRLWWAEGINFTIPRSAVLGGKVNTAGSFGVAPVRIIDFKGATYAIGHNKIAKWNTTTSTWDTKYTQLANPIDAIVATDEEDTWLIVSSATDMVASRDGEGWYHPHPIITNANFEYLDPNDNTKLLGWDLNNTGPTITRDSEHIREGNYSVKIVGGSSITRLYQQTLPWDINLRGKEITFTIWVYANDTNSWRLVIYDGVSSTAGAQNLTANTWEQLTVTRTLDSAATELTIGIECSTSSSDTAWFDQAEISVPDEYRNTKGYCRGYGAWFEDRLYVVDTDGKRISFSGAKSIAKTWGSFTLTGEQGTVFDAFTGKLLATGEPALFFVGTDGLFSVDTLNQVIYRQEANYPALDYAGKRGIYWNGEIWVAAGYGLIRISSTQALHIGPDLEDGLPAGYQGYIYDLDVVRNWLLFCVNGGTTDKSSIMKRNYLEGGNLPVYTTADINKPITCIHHSPSTIYTNGRLWWGEGTDIKYMMFPDKTDNVKQISSYEYVSASGYAELPILRHLAVIPKTALAVYAVTADCDASNYIEVFYGKDGASPTTLLGSFKVSPLPPALLFEGGAGLEFHTLQLAIKMYRGTTETTSPLLESLVLAYFPTADILHRWVFNIDCTPDQAPTIIEALEEIRDNRKLVPFYPSGDPAKTYYWVKLSEMPLRFYHDQKGGIRGWVTVTVEEVK